MSRSAEEKDEAERAALIARLVEALRLQSGRTVLMHQAVADHLGLNLTDHKCLDILVRSEEPLTAGQLAEHSGLTTGAVTGVIDRLEAAKLVRRQADKNDRRRVILQPRTDRIERSMAPVFAPIYAATMATLARYTTAELSLVLRFLHDAIELTEEQSARLKSEAKFKR